MFNKTLRIVVVVVIIVVEGVTVVVVIGVVIDRIVLVVWFVRLIVESSIGFIEFDVCSVNAVNKQNKIIEKSIKLRYNRII